MSSYIMHLCISNIIKEKYNLSNKFIYGSIFPDLLKELGEERSKTHFTAQVEDKYGIKYLPQIEVAENELKDKLEYETYLGYMAHLIEDYIWFDKYIPMYTKKINEKQVIYHKDNTLHSIEEYRKDIYSDYRFYAKYIIDKYNLNLNKTINDINCLLNDNESKIFMKNISVDVNVSNEAILIDKQSVDDYINEAAKQVNELILKNQIISI